VAEPVRQRPVVAGDAEEAKPDHEQPGHRAGPERDVQRRLQTRARRLRGADVRPDGDVHPDEPGRRRQRRADQEADRRAPAELVVEAEQEERDDRDRGDREVLTPQVRLRALLHRALDLAHALVARRAPEQPDGEADPVRDGHARADQREQNRMVVEEAGDDHPFPLTKSAPSPLGAARFLSQSPGARAY
jgi:hypothetical protein